MYILLLHLAVWFEVWMLFNTLKLCTKQLFPFFIKKKNIWKTKKKSSKIERKTRRDKFISYNTKQPSTHLHTAFYFERISSLVVFINNFSFLNKRHFLLRAHCFQMNWIKTFCYRSFAFGDFCKQNGKSKARTHKAHRESKKRENIFDEFMWLLSYVWRLVDAQTREFFINIYSFGNLILPSTPSNNAIEISSKSFTFKCRQTLLELTLSNDSILLSTHFIQTITTFQFRR